MPDYKLYRKSVAQPMRPYIPGEDLAAVSVNSEDVPSEGGMIAMSLLNPKDKWYVSESFFKANYIEV